MGDIGHTEKERKANRILSVLKTKINQLESIEEEIESGKKIHHKSPRSTRITLERLLVPPLSALKEKKKRE
jgi:hypothetical protein